MENPLLERTGAHLVAIGLEVVVQPGASGFVPGVRISKGVLYVDPGCRPSNLLHEAGHLATVPDRYRHIMEDNLAVGFRKMFADIDRLDLDPDPPLQRAAIQCSDPEATAWAWAAGIAIGLPPEQIIQDDEYDGEGADIRFWLKAGSYSGINGLAHAGLCRRGYLVPPAERYPVMRAWLQTADLLEAA